MRENIIQKRKISAAICEEWLERDKVLSGRQKDAIRQYVRMHTDKPEELYQIYHAMIRGENYKAETLEVLMEEGQPVIKIAGNEIRAAFEQLNDFVQKLILLTERTLPLGSVVEVDIRELKLETEKPVSSIKVVIVDRFMKKETEKQYVPYCGIIYPFGDSKKQLFFTEQAIHTVIHYGYTDRQEDAYVALIKREIIKKDIVPTVLRRQKMTKSECYSQISTCNAGIEEDQKKIREWEEKIDLYENTNRRLERGQKYG